LTDSGLVLLDGGLRDGPAELLDVSRDGDPFDRVELEPELLAPVEEPLDRPPVSHADVACYKCIRRGKVT
jgi:hypothetical protein